MVAKLPPTKRGAEDFPQRGSGVMPGRNKKNKGVRPQKRAAPAKTKSLKGKTKVPEGETKSPKGTSVLTDRDRLSFDLICACDGPDIIDINQAGLDLLGFPKNTTAVGQPFAAFVASKESKKLSKSLASLTKGKAAKRLTLVGVDGRQWAADIKAIEIKSRKSMPRCVIVAHSADPDAVAAGPRNPRDRRYRDLVAASTDCFLILRKGVVVFVNATGLGKFGDDGGRLIGMPFLSLVHPDFREAVGDGAEGLLKTDGEPDDRLVMKVFGQSGDVYDMEARAWQFGSDGDNTVAVELRDVTRRIRAAQALLESEERLKGVMDAVADAVVSIDERGIVRSFNAAAEKLFSASRADALGHPFERFVPDWTAQAHSGKTVKPKLGPSTVEVSEVVLGKAREVEAKRADGEAFPAEINVNALQQGADSLFTAVVRDITERKEAEEAQKVYAARLEEEVSARTADLRKLSRQTRQILEAANEGIVSISPDGQITMANPTAAEILDRDLAALKTMSIDGAFILGAGHPDAGMPLDLKHQLEKGPYYVSHDVRLARGDGTSFDAEYAIAPIREKAGVIGYVLTFRDVTERRQAESDLRLAATVFEHTSEGLLVADAGQRVTKTNKAFTGVTGYSGEDVQGQLLRSVLFFDDKIYRDTMADLDKAGQIEWEQWGKNKKGERFAARLALSVVKNHAGAVQQYVAILNDITQRKLDEEQIRYQANYDQLTGLPNRALFMDRLARLVIESRRTKTKVGLMFIDLDGFKAVNDSLGHDAGDLLLKQTADRLGICVRESDTVARLGGDEFTVIMPLIDSIDSTVVVANRILESLIQPFDLDGQEGRISASIGISMYPEQAEDDKQLLRNADVAMFHAKSQGKANYQFYREGLEIDGVPEREAH